MKKYLVLSILVLASMQSNAFELSDLSIVTCSDSMMNAQIDLQNGVFISKAQHGTTASKITNIQYKDKVISFDFAGNNNSSGWTIEDIFEVPSSGEIYGTLYLDHFFKQASCTIYRK